MTEHVEREQLIAAAPDQVWEVITGDGWLAEEVALELTPGGEARFRWADTTREGWVEEAIAPDEGDARLVFWWAHDDEVASRVQLTLEPEGEQFTRLRVVETRPLEILDVTGIPLRGASQSQHGPMLLAA